MIRCSPFTYILGAAWVLLLPLDWLLSAMTAGLVHECCHLLAVRLFGGRIFGIRIGPGGCVIDSGELEWIPGLVAILAGPVGSLSLLAFRRALPKIAVCGMLQGLFNLLPVLPLDGGRILHILLCRWIPDKAEAVLKWMKFLLFSALALCAIRVSLCL